MLCSTTTGMAQHEGDIFVGRSSADQLKIGGFSVATRFVYLRPVDGVLKGWADNIPGFDRIINADPDQDLYPLRSGSRIYLVIDGIAPAFRVLDTLGNVYDEPGEAPFLGNENLHTHLIWHINRLDSRFDPEQCVWDATFNLNDDAGRQTDSTPFTVSFTNVALRNADADLEPDGDVDLIDVKGFAVCMSGPTRRPAPDDPTITTCEVECTNAFDFDADRDVDLRDFAELQNRFAP